MQLKKIKGWWHRSTFPSRNKSITNSTRKMSQAQFSIVLRYSMNHIFRRGFHSKHFKCVLFYKVGYAMVNINVRISHFYCALGRTVRWKRVKIKHKKAEKGNSPFCLISTFFSISNVVISWLLLRIMSTDRRNSAELTLPQFYEDFQISGVYAFESGHDTFDAIKSKILQETNSRST